MAHRIDWQTKIEEYKQSGMTQRAWCKEQEISMGALYYHLRKTHKTGCSKFVELPAPSETLKLYIGSAYLELDGDFDERILRRFLQVVGGLC